MENLHFLERQLKALANRRRLQILVLLKRKHNATVGEIVNALRMSQQAISSHLRILHDADIIEYHKRGLYVSYRLKLKQSAEVQGIVRNL
jgi:ArsR family transcriptional regulator, arsenate/arsenite/antimonite-responsive transcriptional repressor